MRLLPEEENMLNGKYGYPVQIAMEILLGLGECFEAKKTIPVNSAHMLYSTTALDKAGMIFVQELADKGAKFVIPAHTNPSCLGPWPWKDFGISDDVIQCQMKIMDAFLKMGALLCCTCTPYQVGHVPRMGEHVAWSESSAIIFANSVLGARTNREGGPSSLAAALTGRVPEYGYHLDENRNGGLKIIVTAKLKGFHDYGTLGYYTGKVAKDGVPVLVGLPLNTSWDKLKILGGAMATAGSVALFHAIGITPEAPDEATAFGNKIGNWPTFEFGEKELRETEDSLSQATTANVDLVILGCPHTSIFEFENISRLLSGKKVKPGVELWIITSQIIKTYAEKMGYLKAIEASGAKVICDSCPNHIARAFFNLKSSGSGVFATNSAKLPFYVPDGEDILAYYGSTEKCIEVATSGIWS
ncbi:aconitase X [Thermodesulfobacteriota bacterium]